MERRALGQTGLELSTVGFGTWATGGDYNAISLGSADDEESIAAIHAALEIGVSWIDTAAAYGLGHAERVVARALKGMREPPLVFTKCGFVWDDAGAVSVDLSPASIREQIDASLGRLETNTIDLCQIHWLNPENDPELEDCWSTLGELKQAGKLRHIGVSNLTVAQMRRASAIHPVETLQPPYSLLERGIEAEILPYCVEQDIGVIVYSPMQSGLLTGRMTRERIAALPDTDARLVDDPNFSEPRLTESLALAKRLSVLAEEWGFSPGGLAVAWTVAQPGIDGAIVGFRRPAQVQDVLGRRPLELSPEQVAALDKF